MTNATQIIILGIFILFLIVGVIVFATYGTSNTGTAVVQVEIWGTLPSEAFTTIANTLNNAKAGTINMIYKQIPSTTFEQTLVEALADGTGPDAVLLPNDLLYKNQKKLAIVDYKVISERDFKDSFIEGSEILLTSQGSIGLPFIVDPLVMYWNRDLLTAKGVTNPPASWEELLSLTQKLTERKDDKTILKSAVAFGDYSNVLHSKDILSALMLQAGSRMVMRDAADKAQNFTQNDEGFSVNPVDASFSFFTQFADPLKPIYSWNRALPDSLSAFLNGDLALYFGLASEAALIRNKNPNLNFDVVSIPQSQNSVSKKTVGTIYSFSILASSKKQQAALNTVSILTGADVEGVASNIVGLPPARRDVLANTPGTGFGDVFYKSALWTKSWLDPEPVKSDAAFRHAVDSIVTGRTTVEDAAKTFSKELDEILR